MKQFPYVEDQEIVTTNNENGQPEKGQTISHYNFLSGRLTVDAFIEGRPGLDGLCLVATTRIELDNQKGIAKERGFWLLEDDRAEAMLRAVDKGPYNMALAPTLLVFAQATKDMKTYSTPNLG